MADIPEKERKQLVTFLKYFALKSSQVIIQSRNGVKVVSSNRSEDESSKHDWFNLAIPDNDNISLLTNQALNGETENSLKRMMCIDINLKFIEGGEHLLETWSLDLSPEKDMKLICGVNEVYHRMGILLKSLLTITRLQPAYKLARKQDGEPYSLTYSVYCGDPQKERLGEHTKTINVGNLALKIGTMKLSVTYTTDLAMGTNRKAKYSDAKTEIMVKSDHFKDSPRKDFSDKVHDLNKPLSAGAFVDTIKIEELHKALQQNLPPEPPMAWLLSQIDDSPEEKTSTKAAEGASGGEPSPNASRSKAIEMPANKRLMGDQTYHRKLEFPFADGSPITELANFYHECLTARSQSDEWCDVAEEMNKLSDTESVNYQLKVFEDAVPEFDNMVASMFSSSSDKNES